MISQEYRPLTLDKIVGHDKVVQEVRNRFLTKTWPQVSYFSGLSGGGKTTFALNIAKIIQCESPIDEYTPCNECSYCMDINKESFKLGTHMFNGSNLDTETMRDIEEITETTSAWSNKIVIILDELQELHSNKKAQKNLLKALEKENTEVYFILLSMDDSKVDKAIRGRSVHYKLFPVDYMIIGEYLYNICTSKGLELDEVKSNILITIAENSGGSVRQGCAYLERVISGNLWTEEDVNKTLNFVNSQTINNLCLQLIDQDPNIFSTELNEDVIEKIKSNLIKLSKNLVGATLSPYEKTQIDKLIGYKNATIQKVLFIIDTLNELFRFPYINKELIDSILLKIFVTKNIEQQITKSSVEDKPVEEVKRRRTSN